VVVTSAVAVVTVHSLLGQEIQRHMLAGSGLQHLLLDLEGLAAGLYLVRVQDGRRVRTQKVVRQ
jgi:hypothetical protein